MKRVKFKQWDCVTQVGHYSNGRLAIQLNDYETGKPVAVATVNLPEMPLPEGHVFIKDYSENEGMLAALEGAGIVKPTGNEVHSGFVVIPECKLLVTEEELA